MQGTEKHHMFPIPAQRSSNINHSEELLMDDLQGKMLRPMHK